MSELDCYAIGSFAVLLLAFYFLRRVPAYVAACAGIMLAVLALAILTVPVERLSSAVILVLGVGLSAFGLLIVRVMFIRSVSLNMLRSIEQRGVPEGFGEDIGGRLGDMRAFGLIRRAEGAEYNTLTGFGRVVSGFVAAFYALLRVRA